MLKEWLTNALFWKIILIITALVIGLSSVYIFRFGEDNRIEEMAEKIIKEQSGYEIDLTPSSVENKE